MVTYVRIFILSEISILVEIAIFHTHLECLTIGGPSKICNDV